jgi:Protein of unknown function (DUF3592)
MKTLNVIKYIFSFIGVGMLIGAFFIYLHTSNFIKNAISTDGVVVELIRVQSNDDSSDTFSPIVRFKNQYGLEIEFKSSSSSSPASFDIGEKVMVYYELQNPQNAKIKAFFELWGVATIVGGIGIVFALIGFGFFVNDKLKKDKIAYLKQNGSRIETDFQKVKVNSSFEVNGRNPFQILTQWQNPMTQKIHIFTSDNIWFDPSNFIKENKIKVLIDIKNTKKYWVDITFLPNLEE